MDIKDMDTSDWTQEDWATYYDSLGGASQSDEDYWKEQMDGAADQINKINYQISMEEKLRADAADKIVELLSYIPDLPGSISVWKGIYKDRGSAIADLKARLERARKTFEECRSEYWNVTQTPD